MDYCLICDKPVPDYEPITCCDGQECACRGNPINPCVCGRECEDALFANIGEPYDKRRKLAGIALWVDPRTPGERAYDGWCGHLVPQDLVKICWEKMPSNVKNAWEAAARAVQRPLLREIDQLRGPVLEDLEKLLNSKSREEQ